MLAFNAAISARSSYSIHILFIFYYIYLSAVVYKDVIILYKTSYYLFLGIQKRPFLTRQYVYNYFIF